MKSRKPDTLDIINNNILYTNHKNENKQKREESLWNSYPSYHILKKCNSEVTDSENGVKSPRRAMNTVESKTLDQTEKIDTIYEILNEYDQIDEVLKRCVESGLTDSQSLIEKLIKNGHILRSGKILKWIG